MNVVMFAYTIGLILFCATAAVIACATYVVTHRRALLPQAGFFVFYILDLLSIFGYEWSSQNLPFDPTTYYEIENPVLRTLISAGILFCLWLMLLNVLDAHGRKLEIVPVVCFVVVSLLILKALPYGPLRQWLYYTMRQVFVTFALAYAILRWRSSSNEAYKARLERYKYRFLLLVALLVAIVIEDVLVILVMPIPSKSTSWLLLYLSSRNFSENLMMLFVAYHCCRTNLQALALRFEAPPTSSLSPRQDTQTSTSSTDLKLHIEEQLPSYANSYHLSPREREVLGMLLEGKDNRSIANELVLAEGTIKTHVHNIMKKTGASSRDELKKDFWSK